METLTTIISFLLLFGLISVPILLFVVIKKWHQLNFEFMIYYFIIGVILTAGIIWVFTWWLDYSNQLLMSYYGYDFNAMNDTVRFKNIEHENLERVKQLEIGYFGVGWPLKAIMFFVLYSPYLLIVYLGGQLLCRVKKEKTCV